MPQNSLVCIGSLSTNRPRQGDCKWIPVFPGAHMTRLGLLSKQTGFDITSSRGRTTKTGCSQERLESLHSAPPVSSKPVPTLSRKPQPSVVVSSKQKDAEEPACDSIWAIEQQF